ncbi:hypothetical protein CR513_46524, partial [Mucuna pruriens]
MVPSTLRGESRDIDRVTPPYTLISVPQDNGNERQSYECDEFCGTPWRIARTIVGLSALVIFCLMIPFVNRYNFSPISQTSPPRFFLHSLRVATFNVSQGELTATWNVNLTISNGVVNSSFINFLNLKALMVYKEDKALALSAPIKSQGLLARRGVFVMDKNENKTLCLSFNTTGWERDQPIVDDDVVREIDEERKVGVMTFGLKIEVEAEIQINMINVLVAMHPYCSNLQVDLAPLERGEVATLDYIGQDRECFDNVDQWNINKT